MNFLLHVIIMANITLLVVLGYNVVFGKGKILHFGQEAFSLVSAYTLWVLIIQYEYSYVTAFIFAVIAIFLMVIIFTWLSMKLEPDGFGVMSIAVHLAVLVIILNWNSVTRGALGFPKIPRAPFPTSLEGFALVSTIVAVIWTLVIWRLDRSSFGRALSAISEHGWHAQALGIKRQNIHLIAFIIAGFGSILSAVLYVPYISLLNTYDYMFSAMIFFVMIVLAGGPGRVWGVIIAVFGIIFLREGIRFINLPPDIIGSIRLMLFGIILFVAVWLRRDSLFPAERKI